MPKLIAHRLRLVVHLAVAAMLLAGSSHASPGDIELQYRDDGPWATTHQATVGCCDSTGHSYTAWWPTLLGNGGIQHPVITWGNGTGAPPEAYSYLLNHLATWGFVVIASRQTSAGSGQEMRDAVEFLRAENNRPASPFYQHLDLDRVGAVGHSQGAMGAINALRDGAGSVRTVVAVATPAQKFCPQMGHCADSSTLSSGSVFYINGSLDRVISPSTQTAGDLGLQSNQAFYRATSKQLDKAWGTLVGTAHSDIMGSPGCVPVSADCRLGALGFLGYITAWLMDRLQDDATAHAAFISKAGEFFQDGNAWRHQISDIKPLP